MARVSKEDFDIFYATPLEGEYGKWVATCPHGEQCWCDGPGEFFCANVRMGDSGGWEKVTAHAIQPTEYLMLYKRPTRWWWPFG